MVVTTFSIDLEINMILGLSQGNHVWLTHEIYHLDGITIHSHPDYDAKI